MEKRFSEAAKTFLEKGGAFSELQPFPPLPERSAYEQLPQQLKERLITMGEARLGYAYPSIRATDFMDFCRTGNRVTYENLYFSRRHALNDLVLAECTENKGRFLDDIINGILAICEESAWQLPPHNSYLRGAPSEILPDLTRPVLDLFACETGAQLACICYLMRGQLDAVSPYLVTRIRFELERRILTPYLHEHFWWMGQGEEPMCNWTPWCTQNVLIAAFLSDCPQETRRAVLLKSAESLDFFLKDYGEDGCCDEGAQYFRHAGLCLDMAADLLNRVTDGAFSRLYQWEKIKNVAAYIYNVHVDGKYYFNFADCSPVAGRAGVREYLFGKHTGQKFLMRFAAEDFRSAEDAQYRDESYLLSLYYRLLHAFTYAEISTFPAEETAAPQDIFYPSIGLFISRSDAFCLAVKAGDNDDNHNHNDIGSLTLYKNGSPILADIGVESYCAKTFSSRRYEIWTMQSAYHNLPTIDGLDQHDGASYRATGVSTAFSAEAASISMELSDAYPFSRQKRSYVRQVTLDKTQNLITLTDTTDCEDVLLNFISYHKPEATGNSIQTGDATLTFSGARLDTIEVLPITDARLQTAWEHELYRIRLRMTAPVFRLRIR